MDSQIESYLERQIEIEMFFKGITALYNFKDKNEENTFCTDDFLKILKSNAFLMLYNLVESSVTSSILAIYAEVRTQQLPYASVCQQIQNLWADYILDQAHGKDASHKTYKKKALDLVYNVYNSKTICLEQKAMNVSGNLDLEKILSICRKHGILEPVKYKSEGAKLETIKDRRNALAHGEISFVECGRDCTIGELIEIKDKTFLFLDEVIQNINLYYTKQEFKA